MGSTQAPQVYFLGDDGIRGHSLTGWHTCARPISSLPQATLTLDQGSRYQWTTSTTDVRALQSPDATSRREIGRASCRERVQIPVVADAFKNNLNRYAPDWHSTPRRHTLHTKHHTH